MSYDSAVANLYALGHELARTPSHKFDLAHMRVLLAALGHPEQCFASMLIAGTNGKGSTAATLASILRAAGYRTALYTSPHLVRLNERIRINGEEIGDQEFAALHDRVEETANRLAATGELPWHPSFFEMLTAIAFEHFAQAKVDIAVLEVGMGGRLDATNVVEPLISVITDISLDHQKFLGNTIAEIAGEKAGIIHPGGVVVTLPQHPAANDVIGHAVLERGARAISAVPYVPPVSPAADATVEAHGSRIQDHTGATLEAHGSRFHGNARATMEAHGFSPANQHSKEDGALAPAPRTSYPVEVMGQQILVESPLIGRHQYRNIALAIAAAVELNSMCMGTAATINSVGTDALGCPGERSSPAPFQVSPSAIAAGIRQTRWPGRFQVIPAQNSWPELVLDVAHNPAGAWALRSALSQHYGKRRLTFVFGAMRDKAIAEIAEILFPLAEHIVATRADNPRSATAEEIREAAARTGADVLAAPNIPAALAQVRSLAGPQGLVVITGSIYIVGEAMRELGLRA
ncbi:MAG TPA: folylpolyglutamate synthase/dihydrofolate synthase family protein [Terriglobales bacterium]